MKSVRSQPTGVRYLIGDEPVWHTSPDGASTVVGWITSGGYAHYAGKSVALGYVPCEGESVAQVSSQKLVNLAVIDEVCNMLVLRPLAMSDKQDIVDLARKIGTEEFSAVIPEYCGVIESFDANGQVFELPFGARTAVFEQWVNGDDLVGREVRIGRGFVGVEVGDDVVRGVHSSPVAGVGADDRVHAGLLRNIEAEAL